MASAADIPTDLLSAERRDQFVKWLDSLPLSVSLKRRLVAVWQDATGVRLTADQYKTVLGSIGKD